MVRHRLEEVPRFKKKMDAPKGRRFVKENSVFATWRLDDEALLAKCLAHDIKYWKVHKVVKDKEDYDNVCAVIEEHYEILKNTHIELCTRSHFPFTQAKGYLDFAKRANFVDKQLKSRDIDRLFVATNYEEGEQDGNPDNQLVRFEFIEMLVRIAKEKYH